MTLQMQQAVIVRKGSWKKGGMGWLWLVGSLQWQVSFAEYRLFYRALFAKETYDFEEPMNRSHPIATWYYKGFWDREYLIGMPRVCLIRMSRVSTPSLQPISASAIQHWSPMTKPPIPGWFPIRWIPNDERGRRAPPLQNKFPKTWGCS